MGKSCDDLLEGCKYKIYKQTHWHIVNLVLVSPSEIKIYNMTNLSVYTKTNYENLLCILIVAVSLFTTKP